MAVRGWVVVVGASSVALDRACLEELGLVQSLGIARAGWIALAGSVSEEGSLDRRHSGWVGGRDGVTLDRVWSRIVEDTSSGIHHTVTFSFYFFFGVFVCVCVVEPCPTSKN